MNVLVIQHSAADASANAGEVIERLGGTIQTICIDRGDDIPSSVDFQLLMTFGGPITLFDTDLPEWVAKEKQLIRSYAQEGCRVIGICLGAQLVASAFGARVRRSEHAEVGWHKVEKVAGADQCVPAPLLPDFFTAFHWHQNTFDLPDRARHLLRSEACASQAFSIDDRIFGFQFHLEANERTVRMFTTVSQLHQQVGPYIQSESEIEKGIETYLPAQKLVLEDFLKRMML